eukprot:3937605-Rhodomonas_salina.3
MEEGSKGRLRLVLQKLHNWAESNAPGTICVIGNTLAPLVEWEELGSTAASREGHGATPVQLAA